MKKLNIMGGAVVSASTQGASPFAKIGMILLEEKQSGKTTRETCTDVHIMCPVMRYNLVPRCPFIVFTVALSLGLQTPPQYPVGLLQNQQQPNPYRTTLVFTCFHPKMTFAVRQTNCPDF